MKTGLTLEQLAAEITRQNNAKADYMVSTRNLKMDTFGNSLYLHMLGSDGSDSIEPLEVGQIAHRQLSTYLGIPAKYYDKMLELAPDLLAYNANHWFGKEPEDRMVRTLDGTARAFLSSRYRRIDNYEVASAVLPIIGEIPDAQFESCEITESKMYIKVVNPRLVTEVVPGDVVQAGIVITNCTDPQKLDLKSNDWRSVFLCQNTILILRKKLYQHILMVKVVNNTLLLNLELNTNQL